MIAFDWEATSLGAPSTWPSTLKSAVRVLLDCRLPMYLAWGPDFTQFYNDAYVPILGDKDNAALGNDARVTWSEIWPTIGPMWAQVLEGQGIGSERFKLTIERYGYPEDCYFSFSYSPVPDESGKPGGVLVTFAETTREVLAERRQAFQLNLADALRRLASPVEIMERAAAMLGAHVGAGRAGYGEIDPLLTTVSVERDWTDGAMESLGGESRPLDSFGPRIIDELKAGRTLRLHDIGADERSVPYAAGYASIGTRSLLVVPLMKNGAMVAIMYLHHAKPHYWSDIDVQIAEDVAQRTWDAVERARAENELVLASRRKDEFLAMLAHELRNPLAPISTAAQLLGRGGLDPTRAREASKIVARQVNHMSALLDDLLDVSRVTRGTIEVDLKPVDLRAVIDAAIEQVGVQLRAKSHRLHVDRQDEAVVVDGDFVRLVQVVANVLNNAAKYSPDGTDIAVSLARHGTRARLVVRDEGCGIDADLLPHVFDLFVQGSRTLGRTQGGLGIGLALVKTLVERHGGHIHLDSAGEHRGTVVTIELPCIDDVAVQAAPAPLEPDATSTSSALRVLLVDDNVDAARSLAFLLEEHGHDVTVVHTGREALAVAPGLHAQVVILDIGLPDIDGYDVFDRLQRDARCSAAKFIALTGYGQADDVARAMRIGFWRHMTKPASTKTLFGWLNEASELARAAVP